MDDESEEHEWEMYYLNHFADADKKERGGRMSGGSYDYIYSRLEEECKGRMYDEEMNDMIKDLCNVLHDLEWWISGDCAESKYRKSLTAFKKKWFGGDRESRLKGYIDNQLSSVRNELYKMIGEGEEK